MKSLMIAVCAVVVAACTPSYSPNTYASNAVQLANKVDTGTIAGYREVRISANGTVGTVTGGAVGGVLSSEYTGSALMTVAGTTVGAAVGQTVDHAMGDTTGWEYIVRKTAGDLVSVTQREPKPIPLGQKVLVINGPQARVIADYSTASAAPAAAPAADKAAANAGDKPVKVEVVLSLPPGVSLQSATGAQVATVSQAATPEKAVAPGAKADATPAPIVTSAPAGPIALEPIAAMPVAATLVSESNSPPPSSADQKQADATSAHPPAEAQATAAHPGEQASAGSEGSLP